MSNINDPFHSRTQALEKIKAFGLECEKVYKDLLFNVDEKVLSPEEETLVVGFISSCQVTHYIAKTLAEKLKTKG